MSPPPLTATLAILIALSTAGAGSESSFTSAPDASWQRVEPLAEIGQNLVHYDFSGQTCRITCAVPPPEVIQQFQVAAAPRANLFAPADFADSVASVDVLAWQPPVAGLADGSFPAVFTRVQPLAGFGKTTGMALALQTLPNGQGRLRIYLSDQEVLIQLAETAVFDLDPARAYRLVLASRGNHHTGRIFDLAQPGSPLAETAIQHPFLATATGRCGFGALMPHPLPLDVTFDNFLAWDGTPPALTLHPGILPGTIELLSDTRRTMATILQSAPTLADPDAWLPASPLSTTTSGDTLIRVLPIDAPRAFFRLQTP